MKSAASKKIKNRILLTAYIYRTLPVVFLKTAAKDSGEKELIRWIIKNLIKQDLIATKTSKPLNFDFIHLTLKGYRQVTTELLRDPKRPFYRYKTSRSLLKPIFTHSFLNFAYIWNFHKKNNTKFTSLIQVYEDSDINNCKVSFTTSANDIRLKIY